MRSPLTHSTFLTEVNAATLSLTQAIRSSVLPARPVCAPVQPEGIHGRFVADLGAAHLAAKRAELSFLRGPGQPASNPPKCPSTTLHARVVAQARQVDAILRGQHRAVAEDPFRTADNPVWIDTAAQDVPGESTFSQIPGSFWKMGWDPMALSLIDTHSHILHGETSRGGFVYSDEYINRFLTVLSKAFHPPISYWVVSGMHANNNIKSMYLKPWLDDLALDAHTRDRRFIPWIRGFNLDDDFFSIRRYIRDRLNSGDFWGIGELIVHGNKHDWSADSAVMRMICRLAIEYDVPVLLHVDLCGVGTDYYNKAGKPDKRIGREFDDERNQRLEELYTLFSHFREEMTAPRDSSFFPSFPQPHPRLRIIIDHAGIGRNDGKYDFKVYYKRMSALLEEFDYLYFTLAGVPNALLSDSDSLTPSRPIFYDDWFIRYWNRFYVSVDVNQYDTMIDSIKQYNMQVEIVETYLKGIRTQRFLARKLLTSNVLGAPWAPIGSGGRT